MHATKRPGDQRWASFVIETDEVSVARCRRSRDDFSKTSCKSFAEAEIFRGCLDDENRRRQSLSSVVV